MNSYHAVVSDTIAHCYGSFVRILAVTTLGGRWMPILGIIGILQVTPLLRLEAAECDQKTALALVDEVTSKFVSDGSSAGVAVGVIADQKVIFQKGFGWASLENSVLVTPDTVFRIGSLTKQYTAAAIMLLVERGEIKLDDKLARFFPEFPRAREVDIQQLLNHTSGIHSYTEADTFHDRDERLTYTVEEVLQLIQTQDILYDFTPGTRFYYNNSGYFILGAIVEKVSGKSFATFLHDELLSKIGAASTALDNDVDIVARRARGYELRERRLGVFMPASFASMTMPGGAGSMRSSLRDVLNWQMSLFAGKVVQRSSLELMLKPGELNNGMLASSALFEPPPDAPNYEPHDIPKMDFGFGLAAGNFEGHSEIGHAGGFNGFSSTLFAYPGDKLSILILANTGAAAGKLRPLITRALLSCKIS